MQTKAEKRAAPDLAQWTGNPV